MEDGTEWTAHAGAQMKIVVWYLENKNRDMSRGSASMGKCRAF